MKSDSPVYSQQSAVLRQLTRELQLGKSRKGGEALAKKSTKEFIVQRGSKGGSNTRDLYGGTSYYQWVASKRKIKLGWPKGKLRKQKPQITATETINHMNLNQSSKDMFENMIRVGV